MVCLNFQLIFLNIRREVKSYLILYFIYKQDRLCYNDIEVFVMLKKDLDHLKASSHMALKEMQNYWESLRVQPMVQLYLRQEGIVQSEQDFVNFLDQLEVGEDQTIFSPVNQISDKTFMRTHYGLSTLLDHAFRLCYWNFKELGIDTTIGTWITFEQLQRYIQNAEKILTDMNYVVGDREFHNDYLLDIYENPKNYSVVLLESILPTLSEETWRQGYWTRGIEFVDHVGFYCPVLENYQSLNEQRLTPRECEAFYGEKAMLTLGLDMVQENIMTRKRKKN